MTQYTPSLKQILANASAAAAELPSSVRVLSQQNRVLQALDERCPCATSHTNRKGD